MNNKDYKKWKKLYPVKRFKEHFESKKIIGEYIENIFVVIRFEEIGSSIDQIDEDDEEYMPSNGAMQSTSKKKTPKEHVIKLNKFLLC